MWLGSLGDLGRTNVGAHQALEMRNKIEVLGSSASRRCRQFCRRRCRHCGGCIERAHACAHRYSCDPDSDFFPEPVWTEGAVDVTLVYGVGRMGK